MALTTDVYATRAKSKAAKRGALRYLKARKVEERYARQLRAVAKNVDSIVRGFLDENADVNDTQAMQTALHRYADILEPWARSVASRMVAEISQKDAKAWISHSREMGKALKQEIVSAPTGNALRTMLDEQVTLIKSLPLDAAKRVHELTLEAIAGTSARPSEIAAKILETGEVTKSRATLIARTEVARTASNLTLARAVDIGCTHYIWRTSKDGNVRKSHKEMSNKIVAIAEAPVLSDGTQTHAGCIFNCRCWPEPIIPTDLE